MASVFGPSESEQEVARRKREAQAAALQEQIREKKEREAAAKRAARERQAREAREAAEYNPWGRGGGGAPIRDKEGNVVSYLNLVIAGDVEPNFESPKKAPETSPFGGARRRVSPIHAGDGATGAVSPGRANQSTVGAYGSPKGAPQTGDKALSDTTAGAGAGDRAVGYMGALSQMNGPSSEELSAKERARQALVRDLEEQVREKQARKDREKAEAEERRKAELEEWRQYQAQQHLPARHANSQLHTTSEVAGALGGGGGSGPVQNSPPRPRADSLGGGRTSPPHVSFAANDGVGAGAGGGGGGGFGALLGGGGGGSGAMPAMAGGPMVADHGDALGGAAGDHRVGNAPREIVYDESDIPGLGGSPRRSPEHPAVDSKHADADDVGEARYGGGGGGGGAEDSPPSRIPSGRGRGRRDSARGGAARGASAGGRGRGGSGRDRSGSQEDSVGAGGGAERGTAGRSRGRGRGAGGVAGGARGRGGRGAGRARIGSGGPTRGPRDRTGMGADGPASAVVNRYPGGRSRQSSAGNGGRPRAASADHLTATRRLSDVESRVHGAVGTDEYPGRRDEALDQLTNLCKELLVEQRELKKALSRQESAVNEIHGRIDSAGMDDGRRNHGMGPARGGAVKATQPFARNAGRTGSRLAHAGKALASGPAGRERSSSSAGSDGGRGRAPSRGGSAGSRGRGRGRGTSGTRGRGGGGSGGGGGGRGRDRGAGAGANNVAFGRSDSGSPVRRIHSDLSPEHTAQHRRHSLEGDTGSPLRRVQSYKDPRKDPQLSSPANRLRATRRNSLEATGALDASPLQAESTLIPLADKEKAMLLMPFDPEPPMMSPPKRASPKRSTMRPSAPGASPGRSPARSPVRTSHADELDSFVDRRAAPGSARRRDRGRDRDAYYDAGPAVVLSEPHLDDVPPPPPRDHHDGGGGGGGFAALSAKHGLPHADAGAAHVVVAQHHRHVSSVSSVSIETSSMVASSIPNRMTAPDGGAPVPAPGSGPAPRHAQRSSVDGGRGPRVKDPFSRKGKAKGSPRA